MKTSWSSAINELSQQGNAYVIVTLIGVSGSTPRNSGTKMVITKDGIYDTIGGGHLEHKIIKFANQLLMKGESCQHLEQIDLGIHLDQCCGGSTNVLFECFAETRVNIMLFGAGHVGKALLPVLSTLPCKIYWVDSRDDQFPNELTGYNNVEKVVSEDPQNEVVNMPENSYYIVMTHKHQMDFDICSKILSRNDFKYLGLIGSETKWRRFQRRFTQKGITKNQLEQINCPIGLSEVTGKLPAEIAISIVSEIITFYNSESNDNQSVKIGSQGVDRKTIKQLIKDDKHIVKNDNIFSAVREN